jgi:excisionase family DNA binding protein
VAPTRFTIPEPIDGELSIEQAAEVLNVSVGFVELLIGQGKVPAHKDHGSVRLRLEDVQAFKRQIDADRLKALEELSTQAQELKMGY